MPPAVRSRDTDADVYNPDLDAYLDGSLGTADDVDGSGDDPPPRSRSRRDDAADDEDPADDPDEPDESEDDQEYIDSDEEDEEDEDSEDDLEEDEFDRIRAERDAAVAEQERIVAERQREIDLAEAQATEQRWRDRHALGMKHFDGVHADLDRREEYILANYHRAQNPQDYLSRGLRAIRAERKQADHGRTQWQSEFKDAYYGKQSHMLLETTIRAMVAETQINYKLTTAEANKLRKFAMKYPDPDEVGEYFQGIIDAREDARTYAKRAGKDAVKRTARDVAANTPRVGRGQRRQPKKDGTVDTFVDNLFPSEKPVRKGPRERVPATPQGGNLPW